MRGWLGLSMPAVALLGPASAAAAQTAPGPYGYGPQMMWGFGWYGMILGPLFMLLMFAGVAIVAVLVLRGSGGLCHPPPGRTALEILNERLARGEIDQVEYETRKRLISQG